MKCPLIKIFLRARGAGPLWHPSPHGWSETCVCLSGQQTLTTRESLQSLVFIECLLCQKPHQFDLMCLSYHVYFATGRLSPSNPNHCSVSDSKRVDKSAVIPNVSARLKFPSVLEPVESPHRGNLISGLSSVTLLFLSGSALNPVPCQPGFMHSPASLPFLTSGVLNHYSCSEPY